MQFERSNAVKGQQLEYFHLVLAFYAKTSSNAYHHIFSRVSLLNPQYLTFIYPCRFSLTRADLNEAHCEKSESWVLCG